MLKLGLGGGGAGGSGRGSGGKWARPPPPPPRPGARPPAARGVGRGGRQGPGGSGAEPPAREESFSLEPGPLNFAAIIRLTPDIVNEIRRAEAQGGAARIKFDSHPNNHSGNVIDVGGKEFRFTWSRELGDLCDIYEERQSGDDGNGLLVERGATWRKLNVQRILDESTKNHVKMRSEEAERQLKSRKAIVLDSSNPSVKNQAKTMAAAAVEGNMRRMGWKQKKEPFFKKRKVQQNSGPSIVPSKPFSKGIISSNNSMKAMPTVSPQVSPPEQPGPGTSSSPIGTANCIKEDLNIEEIVAPLSVTKGGTGNFGKEVSSSVHETVNDEIGHNSNIPDQHNDLKSLLISVLSKNPKGMNLKSLEKAVGGMIPNAGKKIESIINNIATSRPPGKYFLKPGVELDSCRKRGFESGSSPESARDHIGAAESFFVEKDSQEHIEQETKFTSKLEEESDLFAVIDRTPNAPDPFSSKGKAGNESEARANSSSESGSDSESDSDSSDSESDSGSQSRSPAGSASASSSNSESDNSSSSKEGSDVDVDIMTSDDEKEEAENKVEAPNAKLSSPPGEWQPNNGLPEQNGNIEGHQDGHFASPPLDLNDFDMGNDMEVDITESPINDGPNTSEIFGTEIARGADLETYHNNSKYSEEVLIFSPDNRKKTERLQSYVRNSTDDPNQQTFDPSATGTQTMPGSTSGPEKMGINEKTSKIKSRKASDRQEFQEKPEISKKSKSTSSVKTLYSGKSKDATSLEDLQNITPDRSRQGKHKDNILHNDNSMRLNANAEANMQDYGHSAPGRFQASGNMRGKQPGPDFQNTSSFEGDQPGQRIGDFSGKRKASNNVDKSARYVENLGRVNKPAETSSIYPDESDASAMKSMPIHEKVPMARSKLYKDMRDENGDSSERYLTKNMRESIAGDKQLSTPDSYSRKSGELKECGQVSQFRKSDMENPPVVRKGNVLRRELSDLELGEFREPLAGEINRKLFERKDSFKSSDNKVTVPNNLEQDMSKGRTAANSAIESKRQSPSNMRGGVNAKQDGFDQRVEDNLGTSTRPQQRVTVSPGQPFLKVQVDSEVVSHLDKSTEIAGRPEKKTNEGIGFDKHAPRNDHKHGGQTRSKIIKESKPQKISSLRDSAGQGNNNPWMESNTNGRGRRESSSDEDSFFYSKYDKDEPELKPPIKDYLVYKEYVQEYREKYGHYCSLNKNLENIRNDFLKLGQELDIAKGRDLEEYYDLLEHLKEMYRQHGEKHKQMKKVFILLHEELKHLKQRIKDFVETYSKE